MKGKRRRQRHPRKKADVNEIAAQLAPLEEQNREAARKQGVDENRNGAGAIVIDRNAVQLPKGVNEAAENESALRIEPVVLVIAVVLLAFIAFIAWQVSQMPANP